MLKNKKTFGFTMIELLVVMSIIAILSSISVFALQGARSSGRDAKRKADLEDIRSAFELYKADCNTYPANGDVAFGSALNGDGTNCPAANVYIQELPQDPGSNSYYYNQQSSSTYCLCAKLENVPASIDACASADVNYCVNNP